jgi:predicted ArsR family transcriptional regulator
MANIDKEKAPTQREEILMFIRKHGRITAVQAATELLIMNFTARISDLRRQGVDIRTETITKPNRYKRMVSYNRYWVGSATE